MIFWSLFFFFLEPFFLLMFKMYFSSSRNKLKKLRTGCGIYLICHTFSSDLSLHLASSENSPHSFSEIHFIFRVALRKKPSFWPMPVLFFFYAQFICLGVLRSGHIHDQSWSAGVDWGWMEPTLQFFLNECKLRSDRLEVLIGTAE